MVTIVTVVRELVKRTADGLAGVGGPLCGYDCFILGGREGRGRVAFGGEDLAQYTQNVVSHDKAYFVVVESGVEQCGGEHGHAACVKGCRDGAVEVGAEGDVLDTDEVGGVFDRFDDAVDVGAADGRLPKPDSDETARRGDTLELGVGEVTGIVACAANAGMGDDDGWSVHREDFVDDLCGGMGEVDEDIELSHVLYDVSTEGSEASFFDAVCGAAKVVVEEVGGRHHTIPGIKEELHTDHIAFETVQTLDAKNACGDRWVFIASRSITFEAFLCAQERECPVGV